jgi:hypothetical protein
VGRWDNVVVFVSQAACAAGGEDGPQLDLVKEVRGLLQNHNRAFGPFFPKDVLLSHGDSAYLYIFLSALTQAYRDPTP